MGSGLAFLVAAALAVGGRPARADWTEDVKLVASDAQAEDWLGLSSSLSGDTLLVGAYGSDDAGEHSGSAYVFARNQGGADHWGQVARLTASDAAANCEHGYTVALSGDTAAVQKERAARRAQAEAADAAEVAKQAEEAKAAEQAEGGPQPEAEAEPPSAPEPPAAEVEVEVEAKAEAPVQPQAEDEPARRGATEAPTASATTGRGGWSPSAISMRRPSLDRLRARERRQGPSSSRSPARPPGSCCPAERSPSGRSSRSRMPAKRAWWSPWTVRFPRRGRMRGRTLRTSRPRSTPSAHFCEKRSGELRRFRRLALLGAARNGKVTLPPEAGPFRSGQSKKYLIHDLLAAWQGFLDERIDLPPLLPEHAISQVAASTQTQHAATPARTPDGSRIPTGYNGRLDRENATCASRSIAR